VVDGKGDGMISDLIVFEAESKWVYRNQDIRLNASSYHPESANALLLIDKLNRNGVEIETVGNIVGEIFYPPRFKRIYGKKGVAFLSSKNIFDFLPIGKKIKNASPEYFIQPLWILITRSGSVGRILIANTLLSKAAISEHIIRIIPTDKTPIMYLYAYLNSRIGQPLLTKDIFGGVVDEIESSHIANIPIPRIPSLEEKINQKILEAHKLREEAQKLLLEAEEKIHTELGLPKLEEDDVEYFGGKIGGIVKAFEIKASELEYRLDASYHLPLAHFAVSNLVKTTTGDIKKLWEVADSFVPPRFKRLYVKDPNDGIPLLQGTHIPQIKLLDVKYIWGKMKNLQAYIVKRNWILVTCSGTIGRLALVSDYWDGWAATNHLLRIIPKKEKINPGYITVFLLSIYGQIQFQRLIYGGVVDEIGEAGELFNDILILKPKDKSVEDKIGSLVIEAYNKKDRANQVEREAIAMLEDELAKIAGNS